jgi:2-polyprenyl-6-methoxyphenol hydroxylase-like FAD-dependent oxidoreductase
MTDIIDVLIIGAGPTGGMLALELAMQNISFRIIDSEPIRSDKSRALVLHSRTLELLNRHGGGVEELIKQGRVNMGIRMFSNMKFVFEMDINDIGFTDTMFPAPLMISQAETESFLDKELLKYGKSVERPVTAETLEQGEDGVTACLRHADGTEEVLHCKYVVGCDGAHSIVRKSAGLKFEGAAYPQDFVLADVHLKWTHPDALTIFMGSTGFMVVLPMKDGVFRLILTRPRHLNDDTEPTIEDFEEACAALAPGETELFDPVWISRFRLHHRNVENYRVGRMFMAGDAAHIHSPAGGQGMNTGMQDAVNLGWKLASVIRGENGDSLLDTYNIERHKVGENLLRGTDRIFDFMSTKNPVYLYLRNTLVPWIVPWVMRDRSKRARRFRFISQLGIRYRHSPIVGAASTYKGVLHGGDRAPDGKLMGPEEGTTVLGLCRGPTHHLLLFSGTGAAAGSDEMLHSSAAEFITENSNRVKVHQICHTNLQKESSCSDPEGVVHKLYGFTDPSYVLIRPDGHVSFIGPLSTIDELKAWMKK